jgi:hypothetical protein
VRVATRSAAPAIIAVLCVVMTVIGLAADSASAATSLSVSTRRLLEELPQGREHPAGYSRTRFSDWTDADHDGCDTRDEVLIAEAIVKPRIRSGCELRGGEWRSRYDGVTTRDPSSFDIDHMVPLNEAWQSGAWRWSAATRRAYANDLGYGASLIAVSAHSNRSKGDREPQQWMPERPGYACSYVKAWVAVKWRWRLEVNNAERSYLTSVLRSCGWPRVRRPSPALSTEY